MGSEWPGLAASYELKDVRIIGAIEDGGAVVETVASLELEEGRTWTSYQPSSGSDERLEYQLSFSVPGEPAPEASEAIAARIIIEGTHANGQRVEIRGTGWLGYDDQGRVEGHFDEPPVILIQSDPEPRRSFQEPEPKPPLEYQRATRRSGWSDDGDTG